MLPRSQQTPGRSWCGARTNATHQHACISPLPNQTEPHARSPLCLLRSSFPSGFALGVCLSGNLEITAFDTWNVVAVTRDLLDLSPLSSASIVGRMVIIHRDADQCDQPTGHAGVAIAQGVVGIADPARYGPNVTDTNEAGIDLPWTGNTPSSGGGIGAALTAVAVLQPTSLGRALSPSLSGVVYLSQERYAETPAGSGEFTSRLRLIVNITGLRPYSSHAIHIHSWGDDDVPMHDGAHAGSHWNPSGTPHGFPSQPAPEHHAGDLGNVLADARGKVVQDFTLTTLALRGPLCVVGRAFILHSLPDSGDQPLGGSGSELALGVIGLSRAGLPPPPREGWFAMATLRGSGNFPAVRGQVSLSQPGGPGIGFPSAVTIIGSFFNLPVGPTGTASFALHVHEWGDVSSGLGRGDGASASSSASGGGGSEALDREIQMSVVGGHFNPNNEPHGCHPNPHRHAGDVGNVVVRGAPGGTASVTVTFVNPLMDLSATTKSVIGRSLILHSTSDDCQQPSGHAGVPMAQGVIGIVAPPTAGFINLADNAAINQTASLSAVLFPSSSSSSSSSDASGVGGTIQTYLYPDKKFRLVANLYGSVHASIGRSASQQQQ